MSELEPNGDRISEEDALRYSVPLDAAVNIPVDDSSRGPAGVEELASNLELSVANSLTDLEAKVLRMRFGLQDGRERTFREVGEAIGRSKSTAWRLEKSGIRHLREAVSTLKSAYINLHT